MLQQPDFFDETLHRKIHRMEKWILRLQKELWFLKEVYELSKNRTVQMEKKTVQIEMFK